jgi:hypothetical protein
MTVRFGQRDAVTELRVWVDASRPVACVEARCSQSSELEVSLEVWRTAERELTGNEAHSAYGLHGGPEKIICYPDTVVEDEPGAIAWYHRNEHSLWADNLKHQGLESFLPEARDPLLGRTFGGWIEGEGLVRRDSKTLESTEPRNRFLVSIHPYCAQTDSARAWLSQLKRQVSQTNAHETAQARDAHRQWWQAFWDRSWIFVEGPDEAETVTRGYTLQRWINACGGRGVHPIKFNGSIFTVDMAGYDPDYRRWGGPYWWQNTRLPYWPMLAAGDFDMLQPLFRMYQATIPLAEHRTEVWFGHEGAFFPETMYFWGMYTNANYGWDRGNLAVGELTNRYIRREYTASLELLAMMLDYYAYTGDEPFLEKTLLPMSDSLLRFWDQHYERDDDGHLHMHPAQALETLQNVVNPTTDIAGLKWVLGKLLALPASQSGGDRREFWGRLQEAVPPLPVAEQEGEKYLLGAEKIIGGRGNSENPELYAVFPFRLYGVGKPELGIGRLTFERRHVKGNTGWRQDDTQAAFLGLTGVSKDYVAGRAARHHSGSRFPAFWGPNFDWVPDQDHGGNLMKALQTMLLQAEDQRIWLFPAWPPEWNVEFKLLAPRQTTVEGVYRDGRLERLTVTPVSRRKDVTLLLEE